MITSPELASTPLDEDFEVPIKFQVKDHQSANWVVRKIAEARRYAERIDEWAEVERQRARQGEAFFLRRFETDLYQWMVAELAGQGGKAKSINLPAGRVGMRRSKARIEVLDTPAALAWAAANCSEAIKRTESIRKTPLNEHFQVTGELPDGTILHDAQDIFYVR